MRQSLKDDRINDSSLTKQRKVSCTLKEKRNQRKQEKQNSLVRANNSTISEFEHHFKVCESINTNLSKASHIESMYPNGFQSLANKTLDK